MTDRDVARWAGNLLAVVICALVIPWQALARAVMRQR
jgi:hypothetical protein